MRGHVRKRGKKWAVVIDVGQDESGRRKQRWHSGFDTRKAAERGLTEILGHLQTGAYVEPTKTTLAAFLLQWLDGQRARLRPSTWDSYRRNIEAHVIPALGRSTLQALAPGMLNAFYADRMGGKTRRALSPRTTRYAHMILRRALSDAVRQGLLLRNPADQADPPRPRAVAEMHTWSAVELRAFLEHVRDDRLYAAWLLASSTGMRRGEVLGVRWRDIDFEAGRLSVVQTLITVKFDVRFGTPKTDKGRRNVALDPGTVAALREHRRRQLVERLAHTDAWRNHDLVFTREDGSPLHPNAFSRWFDQHARVSGVPVIRLHDLRHTHATLALAAGIHPKVVSERLGHSNVTITLNTYSHTVPGMQEDAAARVAALVFGA